MKYTAVPFSEMWKDGIFTVPTQLIDKYLKLTSEYQLKALLFILRSNGQASDEEIASVLSIDEESVVDIMEFWCDEGILAVDGKEAKSSPIIEKEAEKKPKTAKKSAPPRLSREDITKQLGSNKALKQLINQAQLVLCRPLAIGEIETIINMVNYYGLTAEVVLMIFEYFRAETQRGFKLSFSYIDSMARNWAEEGIETVEDAESKLKKIEQGNRHWSEVAAIAGIKRKCPTDKQRETVSSWFESFDISMITLAADIMNRTENVTPSVNYMDKILKKWKKLDILTTEKAIEYQNSLKDKSSKPSDKLQSNPTYDLDEAMRKAMEIRDIF
ncbi:MAG: DnaD domain protein [Eubacterium sp.]|nr:DnaD domain protein [Eubacterium sp.]